MQKIQQLGASWYPLQSRSKANPPPVSKHIQAHVASKEFLSRG